MITMKQIDEIVFSEDPILRKESLAKMNDQNLDELERIAGARIKASYRYRPTGQVIKGDQWKEIVDAVRDEQTIRCGI